MRKILNYQEISLEPFRHLPEELWSEDFFRVGEFVNRLVDAAVLKVLESSGITREDLGEHLSSETGQVRVQRIDTWASKIGIAEDRRRYFEWLFEWIGDSDRPLGNLGFGQDEEESQSLSQVIDRALGEFPSLKPSVDLISLVTSQYVEFLQGKVDGNSILFTSASLSLWERYFSNKHSVVSGVNLLGTHGVIEALADSGEKVNILEIGGGLGSAAESLLDRMSSRVERYCFTDVHPGFLRRAKDFLSERFPDAPLEFSLLDINRNFSDQRLTGKFELIYGVNVLHLAVDLQASLEVIRSQLTNGGKVVLVEGIRPAVHRPIAAEYVFQLLPQFEDVQLHEAYRPHRGFLSGKHWVEALGRAGFKEIRAVPELNAGVEAYPNLTMGAFIAVG